LRAWSGPPTRATEFRQSAPGTSPSVRSGRAGGRPGGPGQLTATALTQRELALFLGASAQASRHRVLSAKALTPLRGEGRVRRPQEEAGPTPFRHLLAAGA
jgi:hypothetical protein